MPDFSRRVNVDIIKDEPKTREEWVVWSAVDGAPTDVVDEAYQRYLHYFQPYRWRAVGANNEPLARGEEYHNEADCINAMELLFGDDTTLYLRRAEQGNRVLRFGITDRSHQ